MKIFVFNRIDINIDFNERPKCPDPSKILERLEQIEKETQDRFKEETLKGKSTSTERNNTYLPSSSFNSLSSMNDYDMFQTDTISLTSSSDINSYVDDVSEMNSDSRERDRFPGNNDSLTE